MPTVRQKWALGQACGGLHPPYRHSSAAAKSGDVRADGLYSPLRVSYLMPACDASHARAYAPAPFRVSYLTRASRHL